MSKITTCTADAFNSHGDFLGTKMIALCTSLILETVILCCIMYKLFLSRNESNKKLHATFRNILLAYHISVFMLFASYAMSTISIIFGLTNQYDRSSVLSCIIVTQFTYIPVTNIYLSMILFWFLRLKLVFKGSVYATSPMFNRIMTTWIAIAWITSVSLLSLIFIITLINISTGNADDIFCKFRMKIYDFIPYLYRDQDSEYSYNYKINNFYACIIDSDHELYILKQIVIWIGTITVPLLNLVSFYQYISKMKRLTKSLKIKSQKLEMTDVSQEKGNHNTTDDNGAAYETSQLFYIYLTGIIGAISVGTTLLNLGLNIIDPFLFETLIFIDLILNGILMLMVLDLGQWLVCPCCFRVINKMIQVQRALFIKNDINDRNTDS